MRKKEKKEEKVYINNKDTLTVTTSGNVIEATYRNIASTPAGGYIEKLDNDTYVVKSTGEICTYNHADNRSDNTKSLYRTFAQIRRLVNANTTHPDRCRWVTMTYAENMTDTDRLYNDFRKFNQRFQRRWGKAEYIAVVEPQGRGAWHLHIIYIWPGKAPYVKKSEFEELWGLGFCKVKKLQNNDNLGAYLSAYLGNVSKTEADKLGITYDADHIIEREVDGKKKKFIKGARLHLYPNGFNIIRHSRGIKLPCKEIMTKEKLDLRTLMLEPVFDNSYTTTIEDENGEKRVIEIRQLQFNKLRRKKVKKNE